MDAKDQTTIAVGRDIAEKLREMGGTYDAVLRRILKPVEPWEKIQPVSPTSGGLHSEIQLVADIPGDFTVKDYTIQPEKKDEAFFWTSIYFDSEPDAFYVKAHRHIDIREHSGILTPALAAVVTDNLKVVQPLITREHPIVLDVTNRTSSTKTLEVTIGTQWLDKKTAEEVRRRRLGHKWEEYM
jgi:hypothetical protein